MKRDRKKGRNNGNNAVHYTRKLKVEGGKEEIVERRKNEHRLKTRKV